MKPLKEEVKTQPLPKVPPRRNNSDGVVIRLALFLVFLSLIFALTQIK